jgi:hypothetical protein
MVLITYWGHGQYFFTKCTSKEVSLAIGWWQKQYQYSKIRVKRKTLKPIANLYSA